MPNRWPLVPLGEIATPIERAVVPVPGTVYRQVGVKLWGQGAYEREPLNGAATRYKTLSRVEAGDIIVNKIWARNGSVAVIPEPLAGSHVSGEFPTFVPDAMKLDPRWFRWYTKTKGCWEQCDEKSRGTSGKNRIRPELFLEIRIPLPPLDEQRRIVAHIEQLAAKIQEASWLRGQAIAETEKVLNSQLSAAVERLISEVGSRNLGSLILDGGYGTSSKCYKERFKGAVPVLRIPNVASERVNVCDLKHAVLGGDEFKRVKVEPGDILVVRTNGSSDLVGRCAVVPELNEPMAFASYLIRLRCDTATIDPQYLQLMLKHLRTDGQLIDFARTTAGQYNVSLGRLRAANLPVPPLPEQRRIVAEVDGLQAKVDALKKLQAETATELDALMPSILDRAFRGELVGAVREPPLQPKRADTLKQREAGSMA